LLSEPQILHCQNVGALQVLHSELLGSNGVLQKVQANAFFLICDSEHPSIFFGVRHFEQYFVKFSGFRVLHFSHAHPGSSGMGINLSHALHRQLPAKFVVPHAQVQF